jgi:hypothetical protein
VLAIVLIPSAVLLITGVSVAGYLISDALSARAFASYFAQNSGTLVQAISSLDQERAISLRALGGDRQAVAGLQAQWDTTNAALSRIGTAASVEQGLNPQAMAGGTATLRKLVGELAVVRQGVRTGRTSVRARRSSWDPRSRHPMSRPRWAKSPRLTCSRSPTRIRAWSAWARVG